MEFNHKTKFKLECVLKATISEVIIREMFIHLGWKVFPFGMEHSIPGYPRRENILTDENSLTVRALPDFIIVNEIEKRTEFLEVKYRSNGSFDFQKEFSKRYGGIEFPFRNSFIILVTPDNIMIQQVSELEKGATFIDLNEHTAFEISKETVTNFVNVFRQFVPIKEPEAILES